MNVRKTHTIHDDNVDLIVAALGEVRNALWVLIVLAGFAVGLALSR